MESLNMHKARFAHGVFVVASAMILSGCQTFFGPDGYFRDRADDYLKAEVTTPIKLPEGSEGERIGQLFVIPKATNADVRLPAEFTVPRPSSSDRVTEQRNEIKIQKLGDRRWIDINNPPGEVWPGVREFLAERGMGLAKQDPSTGTLETVWLSLKDADSGADTSATKDRYRLQLEPGLRVDTTEIHVLQMTASSVAAANGQTDWPSQSVNPDREAWMVKELATSLAKDTAPQASMLAQAIGSNERRVELVNYPEPSLSMRVDYARAWASVGGSLNRDGFHVDSANRELGQWQVTYSAKVASEDDDEGNPKPGVFSRIAKIFDFGSKDKAAGAESYRVILQQKTSEWVRVTLQDANGQPLPQQDADRLLRRIRANLL
jgi:outer membrane protein assembly factor BamC